MNIYFAGIGGVGIGPLAQIARDAGHNVMGSDLQASPVTEQLSKQGVQIAVGPNTIDFLEASHQQNPIDWFVYTAALPPTHPELKLAQRLGIKTGKRDSFLAEFIKLHNLKLIAVAGTHGKTTTTGMAIWALKQLGVPVSYSVGTTLSFGPSGFYDPHSQYFVYECDEFDRNFLHFSPDLSLITAVDYDHPDTYPTEDDYKQAFRQYVANSRQTIAWQRDLDHIGQAPTASVIALAPSTEHPQTTQFSALVGQHNRQNARLVQRGLELLSVASPAKIQAAIESFPGTDRRFEKIADNIYSDYGHHPTEIAATLQMASEISNQVFLIYQPHQNVRQHEIQPLYSDAVFAKAKAVAWLPTYLSRENPNLKILSPQELTQQLTKTQLHFADLNDDLWQLVIEYRQKGYLVLAMGAGSIDAWLRKQVRG